jgi:hypothetical protein
VTVALSALMVVLGVAVIVRTAQFDGELGYLLGGLLVLAGALRMYLSRVR